MDFGQEERGAPAIRRQDVPLLMVETLDQTFAAQPAEVVAHLPRGVRRAEQGGGQWTQLCVGRPSAV